MRDSDRGNNNEGTYFECGTIGAVLAATNDPTFHNLIGLRRELRRDEKRDRKWRRRMAPVLARAHAAKEQMLAEFREQSDRSRAALDQRIAVFKVRTAAAIYAANMPGQGLVEYALILFVALVIFCVVAVLLGPAISEIMPTALHLPLPK